MAEPTPGVRSVLARDRANLSSLIESDLRRVPTSIDPIPAGLGHRRFYRIRFDDSGPASMIGRIEDTAAATAAGSPESPAPLQSAQPVPPQSVPAATQQSVPPAPAWLPEPAVEPIRGFLEAAGLRVPRSYAHRRDLGLDLLEDVGDQSLADVPSAERPHLYAVACSYIPRLQALRADAHTIPAFGRRYDSALVATKSWKWLHWTIPLLLDRQATPAEKDGIGRLFARIADVAGHAPMRLSHRDFKAENLHKLPTPKPASGGEIGDPLAMIDVQGAFLAPPEYDLVCLLYDLQVELDEEFIQTALRSTLGELPDREDLDTALVRFDALAVARLCKDLSHVVQAGRVRGDRRRWHEIPRGLTLLCRAAERLRPIFSEVEALTSVIQALTPVVQAADSGERGKKWG